MSNSLIEKEGQLTGLSMIVVDGDKPSAEFLKKTEAMKQQSKEDYLTFDLALKNRDEVMVRIIANKYGFTEDFNNVRELLEDIYSFNVGTKYNSFSMI